MSALFRWVVVAVLLTAVFGTIYLVAQQSERQGADDGPLRLASQLASGASPDTTQTVNLASSEALFFVVYDASGHPTDGTARLDGDLPGFPRGALDAATASAINHVTWQPSGNLRFATVEERVGDTVIMAGQSLTPTEKRIDQFGLLVLAAWGVSIVILAIAYFVDRALRGLERPTQR